MGPIDRPETSDSNYLTPCNDPENRRIYAYSGLLANLREGDRLEDLEVNGRIIFRCDLKKKGRGGGIGLDY